MPLVISPTAAAIAIGAKCGGTSPDVDDPNLLSILLGATERLTAAMNVDSLAADTYLDRFYLNEMPTIKPANGPGVAQVRLSNAFVDACSLVLRDEDGEVVTDTDIVPTEARVNSQYGVIDFKIWDKGYYSLQYDAGFEVGDDDVLVDVPEWMKAAVALYVVSWYRAAYLQPKIPKGTDYENLMLMLQREIQAYVYQKYQRPRVGMIWADSRGTV